MESVSRMSQQQMQQRGFNQRSSVSDEPKVSRLLQIQHDFRQRIQVKYCIVIKHVLLFIFVEGSLFLLPVYVVWYVLTYGFASKYDGRVY